MILERFWYNFGFRFGSEINNFGNLFEHEFWIPFLIDFGGHFGCFLDAKTNSKQKWRKFDEPLFSIRKTFVSLV